MTHALVAAVLLFAVGCDGERQSSEPAPGSNEAQASPAAHRSGDDAAARDDAPEADDAPEGMVWIPGGEFMMGDDSKLARPDEQPVHRVRVDGFWMDATPVTNAQFRRFVQATNHVTTAERPPDLEEMMAQLPPGTPPPDPADLFAASLVFAPQPHLSQNPFTWWK
jgi:formylglycine-generating enzyme required for sulfatase activity